jgi:hypothetical protein
VQEAEEGRGGGAEVAENKSGVTVAVTLLSGYSQPTSTASSGENGGKMGENGGKIRLLQRLLHNTQGFRVAILVNSLAMLEAVTSCGATVTGEGPAVTVVESEGSRRYSNGCACSVLRADCVLSEIRRAAESRDFGHIVVETTGVADPGGASHVC